MQIRPPRTLTWTNAVSLCQAPLFWAPPATVNGRAEERQKEGLKEGSVEGTDREGRRLSRVKASFSAEKKTMLDCMLIQYRWNCWEFDFHTFECISHT